MELFDIKRSESLLSENHGLLEAPEGREAVFSGTSNFPTPLYYASILGLSEVVSLLIERGDKLDELGGYCGSPLHAAAFNGHIGVLYQILEHGADSNLVAGHFGSVLQIASYRGHAEIIVLLLSRGADVNLDSGYYGGALQAAAAAGRKEEVQLLMEYGADVNAHGGAFGNALTASAEGAHAEVSQMLLENGAYTNAQGDLETCSALYRAAARGHPELVRLLLDAGAKLTPDDSQKESPLTAAARGGYEGVVQMLMQAGFGGFYQKISALFAAVQHGHPAVVELLLRVGGCIVNSRNEDDNSPMMIAASRGHAEVLVKLLTADGRYGAVDNRGYTPLMMAMEGGHEAAVRVLIQHGADVEVKSIAGETAMDIAIAKHDHAMVRLLRGDCKTDNSNEASAVMDCTEDPSYSDSPKRPLQLELTVE